MASDTGDTLDDVMHTARSAARHMLSFAGAEAILDGEQSLRDWLCGWCRSEEEDRVKVPAI